MPNALVSVVIPTYNCKDVLRDCLESVRAQTYAPLEVIVVDSLSTDGTRELAAEYGTVYEFGNKPSDRTIAAVPLKRNYAMSKATGEYLYWFDSDMRMPPDTVKRCVELMERTNADAIIIPEESYGRGFWAQCRRLEKDCYNRSPQSVTDAARFLRRPVFEALGGFDVDLGGSYDYDFQLRLDDGGYKTVKLDRSILHYEGALSLGRQLRKKFEYGMSAGLYVRKNRHRGGLLRRQFSIVRPDFVSQWRVLVAKPFTALGMVFMKTLEWSAALAGLLYAIVRKTDHLVLDSK